MNNHHFTQPNTVVKLLLQFIFIIITVFLQSLKAVNNRSNITEANGWGSGIERGYPPPQLTSRVRFEPERRSCSFFDHRNAVPVLFGI